MTAILDTPADVRLAACVPHLWVRPPLADLCDPARLLPPARPTVHYDRVLVRRILGGVGLVARYRPRPDEIAGLWGQVQERMGSPGLRWDRHIAADMAVDETSQTFAARGYSPHLLDRPSVDSTLSGEVLWRRAKTIQAVHAHGEHLVHTYAATGGMPRLPGHLSPDETIECVLERAYAFAATAIAGGVDHIVARTWAGAILVAHGYRRPLLEEPRHLRNRTTDTGVWPRHTHGSDYYAQALKDLHARTDGTRFMTYIAMTLGTPQQ